MNAAIHKIQRDLHRCRHSIRRDRLSGNRHQFAIDRNRKHWTRFELRDAAQQIRRVS